MLNRLLSTALVLTATVTVLPSAHPETTDNPRIQHHTFRSKALGKQMAYTVVLPEGYDGSTSEWPVLFFLHGLGRNEKTLVDDAGCRELLLQQDYVIVLPRGEGGWYINSPARPANRYADYVDELISLVQENPRISRDPALCAIGGWSAGGYGSAQAALRHPGEFTALGTIIGVLDYPRAGTPEIPLEFNVITGVFGTDPNVWQDYNPLLRADELSDLDTLLVIGERAFDRTMNERFAVALERSGASVTVQYVPPGHTFAAVKQGLPYVLAFMKNHFHKSSSVD